MSSNNVEIDMFLNETYLKYGIRQYIKWKPSRDAHFLAFGITGGGKTVATKIILARVAKKIPDSNLYVADYKGDSDYEALEGSKRFYRFMECKKCIDEFYLLLQKRQSGEDKSRNFCLLFFDEWGAFISSLDKKEAEEIKQKTGILLMLGRSYNLHLGLCQQRPDNVFYSAGSRDQFGTILSIGTISETAKEMLFKDFKSKMKCERKRSTGYMVNNGELIAFQVPYISDMSKIDYYIKEAVNR